MEINNLTEPNVKELESKLSELMKVNPEISYTVFTDMKGVTQTKTDLEFDRDLILNKILQEVSEIKIAIKNIFGNHILMDGQFKNLKL